MQLNDPHAVPIRKGPPRPQDAIPPFPVSASSYEITSEDDIGDLLTILSASGEAISMYAAGSREAVLGRILSVDPELPHFVMEFSPGSALPPGKTTFVAPLPTAKLQFRLTDQEWHALPGKPHLIQMTFPETCAVMNRRSSERMETPLGANFTATLTLGSNTVEMTIYDISQGGVGLRCAKHLAKGLLRGRKLRDVQLELGSDTIHVAEMEIRFTRAYRSFLLGEQVHLGCMFLNLAPEEADKIKNVVQVSSPLRRPG